MTGAPPEALTHAAGLLRAGRVAEARDLLAAFVAAHPDHLDGRRGLGVALTSLGDAAGAEQQFRQALRLKPDDASSRLNLARTVLQQGRLAEGATQLEQVLQQSPAHAGARRDLVGVLGELQRWQDLLEVTAAEPQPFRAPRMRALAALDRTADAIAEAGPATGFDPPDLADLGVLLHQDRRFAEAEAALQRAVDGGLDDAGLWSLLGQVQVATGRYDAAAEAFDRALARDPDQAAALRHRAELTWMTSGDAARALAPLSRHRDRRRDDPASWRLLARATLFAEGPEPALAIAEDARAHFRDAPWSLLDVARLASEVGRPDRAIEAAEAAIAAGGSGPAELQILTLARLAAGQAPEAAASAASLVAQRPDDQLAYAIQATAWRLAGDPRYDALRDDGALIAEAFIDAPPGCDSREAFLSDLTARLTELIGFTAAPFDQSLRHSGQTAQDLIGLGDPVIDALFVALTPLIDAQVARLGRGNDVVRRRNTGRWRFQGAWAVLQRAGGHHVNHVHPQGWLSSAFYVDVPRTALDQGHAGWIGFGEPGVTTAPRLAAERFVRPEPGKLVLFPSWMWHGTQPFAGAETRLTFAFDVVPD